MYPQGQVMGEVTLPLHEWLKTKKDKICTVTYQEERRPGKWKIGVEDMNCVVVRRWAGGEEASSRSLLESCSRLCLYIYVQFKISL